MNHDTAMALTVITLFLCVFWIVAFRMWIDYRLDMAEVENSDE